MRLSSSVAPEINCGTLWKKIETGNSLTLRQKARLVPYARRIFIEGERELDTVLRLGIIFIAKPGVCPYASPIIVVAKKDGTLRICVDYRLLNQMTITDAYPIPRIDEIFISLHNAYCFLALELLRGYKQISVLREHRPKTAFITHKCLTFEM